MGCTHSRDVEPPGTYAPTSVAIDRPLRRSCNDDAVTRDAPSGERTPDRSVPASDATLPPATGSLSAAVAENGQSAPLLSPGSDAAGGIATTDAVPLISLVNPLAAPPHPPPSPARPSRAAAAPVGLLLRSLTATRERPVASEACGENAIHSLPSPRGPPPALPLSPRRARRSSGVTAVGWADRYARPPGARTTPLTADSSANSASGPPAALTQEALELSQQSLAGSARRASACTYGACFAEESVASWLEEQQASGSLSMHRSVPALVSLPDEP